MLFCPVTRTLHELTMVELQFCMSSWRLVHRETWYKIIMKFEKNYYSMKQQDSTKNYPDTVWSKNFNQQNKKMKDLCTCGKDPLLVSMYSIVWRVWYGSCTKLVLSVLWIRNFNDFRIQPDPGKSSRFDWIQEKVPDPTGSGFTTLRTIYDHWLALYVGARKDSPGTCHQKT